MLRSSMSHHDEQQSGRVNEYMAFTPNRGCSVQGRAKFVASLFHIAA